MHELEAPPRSVLASVALALVTVFTLTCDGCPTARRGVIPMCGVCGRSNDCRSGLTCVNGTCETTPPSCHVKIGL